MKALLKSRLKNDRGFTLVELLAVIVILGIIAAIAVPSIGGVIDRSERDATVANAEQMIEAARLMVVSENIQPGTTLDTATEIPVYTAASTDQEEGLIPGGYLEDGLVDTEGTQYDNATVYYYINEADNNDNPVYAVHLEGTAFAIGTADAPIEKGNLNRDSVAEVTQ